jgi:hypothetical protein
MYFITVDVDGYLTGMYDGSKDYIHRVTGEAMEGAVQVPDGAIQLPETCLAMIRSSAPTKRPRFDSVLNCIVQEDLTDVDDKRKALKSSLAEQAAYNERVRIEGLTDAEILSLWEGA